MICEAEQKLSVPVLRLSREMYDPGLPYEVRVNPQVIGDLFRDNGLSEELIAKRKITFRKSILGGFLGGVCFGGNGAINLATDHAWKSYRDGVKLAEQLLEHRKKPKDEQFKNILTTKRLSRYLANVSSEHKERALCFARELIRRGVERNLNTNLFHEAKHSIDRESRRNRLFSSLVGLAMVPPATAAIYAIDATSHPALPVLIFEIVDMVFLASMIEYNFDPNERSARKFARQLKYNPRWNNAITFLPRDIS
ncbi:MAG: hypothetical protein Q7S44_01035 [bacterium]|nr:hypothetical protein [bacterium]